MADIDKYLIEPELNLKKIIAELKEVTKALNEFTNKLEQIEKGHGDQQESEEDQAYSFPEVFGEPIEMLIDGVWVQGKVIEGYRSRDGIVNMETADGKKYWCGCERTECYRQPKEEE